MIDSPEVVLVPSTMWLLAGADSGFRETDRQTSLGRLASLDAHRMMEARAFAHQLGRFDIQRMDDRQVLDLIRNAIVDGRAVVVCKSAGKVVPLSATAELRRLVAQVERATRGRLPYRGRQYKLVVDVELAHLPSRDYYEVASQSEARAVLEGIAKESPASAEFLKKAGEKLSKDWRPPLQPDGLVLLRRLAVVQAAAPPSGPALTPSQLEQSIQPTEVIEIELVDAAGEAVPGEAWELLLPDGSKRSGMLDDQGRALITSLPGGECHVMFPALDPEAWKPCGSHGL